MEIKAKVKDLRVAPRKTRLVVDAVRGLSVRDALNQLQFINKEVTKAVEKLIRSGIANATNTYELDENNLFVKEIKVDEGKTLKRWQPRARGRACMIRKRTSHINLVLGELVDSGVKVAKKQELDAPVKLSEMAQTAEEKANVKELNKDKKNSKEKIKSTESKSGFSNKIFRRKSG